MRKLSSSGNSGVRLNSRKNKFLSKFIVILLNTSGIPLRNQNYSVFILYFKYYLIVSFTLLTTCQIVLLKECTKMHEFTVTMVYIINGIFFNITTIISQFKGDNILNMVNIANDEISTVMDTHKEIPTGDEKFKKFFFSYGITYFVIYSLATMAPFLFLPISGNRMGDINTLLIPCWFPWKIDSLIKYILTIGLQFSWLCPLSIPVLLNLTFVVYFVIEVRTQFDILCDDIKKLKRYSFSKRTKEDPIYEVFRRCIQHHQIIFRFVWNFCSYYSTVFMAVLVYSLVNLALLLYSINFGEKTVSAMIQQLSMFVVVLSLLYLYCFIGEILSTANEQLTVTLYDIEWFKQSVQFRKTFLAFLRIIQKTLSLRAGKDNEASFQLFTTVVKLAYSYFNVMSKAFER